MQTTNAINTLISYAKLNGKARYFGDMLYLRLTRRLYSRQVAALQAIIDSGVYNVTRTVREGRGKFTIQITPA